HGKLIGYNTDGNGFIRSLYTVISKEQLHHSDVLIIGAGGAARGIYISLAASGVKNIDIFNRSIEKAESLIKDCPYQVNSIPITKVDAENRLGQYQVIINTTSVGMA